MTVSKIKNAYLQQEWRAKKRHACFLWQLLINIKYLKFQKIKQKPLENLVNLPIAFLFF